MLYDTRARDLIKPVGVAAAYRSFVIQISVHSDAVKHRVAILVVAPVVVIPQGIVVRVSAIVDVSTPHSLAPLLGIHRLDAVVVERSSDAGIEVHLNLVILTFLGCDDDDTIGSS